MESSAGIFLVFLVWVVMNVQQTEAFKIPIREPNMQYTPHKISKLVVRLNRLGNVYTDTLKQYEDVLRSNNGSSNTTGRNSLQCTTLQLIQEGSQRIRGKIGCYKFSVINMARRNYKLQYKPVKISKLVRRLNRLGHVYVDALDEYNGILTSNNGFRESTGRGTLQCTQLQYAEDGCERIGKLTGCN